MTKTLGLALGSGGARGWAHIGVIRALMEADIPIHSIAGASIGAFVGAIHAAGELDELEAFVRELDWKGIMALFDLTFPTSGLLDGNKVYELLTQHLLDLNIEDAGIPFCCVATNLITGQEVQLQTGCMADAVRASISIPGVFTPFERDGCFLGDGGIVNPVPVNVVRQMGAEVVLAINLNHTPSPITSEEEEEEVEEKKVVDPDPTQDNRDPSKLETAIEQTATNAKTENDARDIPQRNSPEQEETNIITRIRQKYRSFQETLQEGVQDKLNRWLPEQKDEKSSPNIFDIIGTTLNVMEQQITRQRLEQSPPDLLIQPDLSNFGIFDFDQADAIIKAGYRQTQAQIPQLRDLIERPD
ncbi:MAG: patatin family protein [Synechococcaceae cyanobacterium SM2_3_2]|nr:patatin family protein [Synechococcaceae cyanobacterium SM2_3_2]